MKILKDIAIDGPHQRPILLDVFYKESSEPKPVVIFCHGFKGFKDWGHFNLVAKSFAEAGFIFIKFNFAFNGTTAEHPTEFVDLEAFGNNNLSRELDDLGKVMDWILNKNTPLSSLSSGRAICDKEALYLMGHSRGGGIVILKAHEDKRVKKIITWAAVHDFAAYWSEEWIDQWKKDGVRYIENVRTGQQMPLYYQFCEDYSAHKKRLDITMAAPNIRIPWLIVHGTEDEAVSYERAKQLKQWCPTAQLLTIKNGNHVFGASHPYEANVLSTDAKKVVEESIEFVSG